MAAEDAAAARALSHRVVQNSAVVFAGQVIILTANLGFTVFLARYLGSYEFGLFAYATVFISLFALLGDFGIGPIVVRELARAPEQSRDILGTAILIKLALNSAAILATIAGAFILDFSPVLRTLIVILAFSILITSKLKTLRQLFESIYEARLRMAYPVLFQTLDALLLVSVALLLMQLKAGLITLTLVYVLCNLPGFLLTVLLLRRYVVPRLRWDRALARAILLGSLPNLLYVVLMAFYERLDVLILKALSNETAVGLYASAARLVTPLSFIPMAVAVSLFPLMSKYGTQGGHELRRTYAVGMKALLVAGLPLGLGASAIGGDLYRALYTAPFWPAALTFAILVWAQVVFFLNFFFANYNVSIDAQRHNVYAAAMMCLGVAAGNVLLIPQWGITGAGVAKLAANLMGFLTYGIFACRPMAGRILPVTARMMGAMLAFGVFLLAVRGHGVVVTMASSLIVYPLVLAAFGVFDENERRLLVAVGTRLIWWRSREEPGT